MPRNPLQGFRTRDGGPSPRRATSNIREGVVNIVCWLSILTILSVLSLNAYLVASKPADKPQNWPIVYSIFAGIILLAAWILVKLFTDRISEAKRRQARGFLVLLVATVIYGGAVGWMTVLISPAKSCTDTKFLQENDLMCGLEERCHMVYGSVIMLWIGLASNVISAVLKVRVDQEADDNFEMG